jgi:hypothetical protein
MKYVKTFESYKKLRNHPINEEFLGGLLNFFKNLWNKATEELKKMGDNPSTDDIDKWIETKIFNPSDASYLFKSVIEEFKKKTEANNEDSLTLVAQILDPETGSLGTQGLQPLYDNLLKVYGKNLAPLETIKFYFETARNKAIKDYKYGGGPEFKVGQEAKISPDAKKMDLADTTHLPDFKKVLQSAGEDNKKKKEIALGWVEKTLTPRLLKYIQEVKPEEVDGYLKSKNIESTPGGEYKTGDTVVYKRDKFNEEEWKKLTDEDKKKTDEGLMKDLQDKEMIGIKKIKEVTGDDISFEDADFKKKKEDILMKIEVDQNEESKKAAESLGKIKDDPEKMKTVSDLADMLQDDAKKDQVDQIKKIISGEEPK